MSASASASAENVLVMKPRNEGRFAHTVSQEDLMELRLLSREFSDARAAWEAKRDYVKAALKHGAGIEDGLLTVELVKGKGGGYNVEVYDFEKVVVR